MTTPEMPRARAEEPSTRLNEAVELLELAQLAYCTDPHTGAPDGGVVRLLRDAETHCEALIPLRPMDETS